MREVPRLRHGAMSAIVHRGAGTLPLGRPVALICWELQSRVWRCVYSVSCMLVASRATCVRFSTPSFFMMRRT